MEMEGYMMFASLRKSTYASRRVSGSRPGLFSRIQVALSVRRERQALLTMDAAMLRDIGMTREEALTEAERPIWDAPATWRR
jgi:uncharacterized protein YjiS (DUF1127 family)